jgi:hypothetical protein
MTAAANQNDKWVKVTQLILTAVALTAVPWCIWTTTRIHSMDVSIVKLETFASAGGRFTAEHGQNMRLEIAAQHASENSKIWQELANIQSKWLKEISTLNTQIATMPQTLQIPPEWWEEYVKTEFARHNARIAALEEVIPNKK